jgi:hypothetical protein
MAISDYIIQVDDLPSAFTSAGHTNLTPNNTSADNASRLTDLMADIVDLSSGVPNAVTYGVHLSFPPGKYFYFNDTAKLDKGSTNRWGGGLWIFGGGVIRNPETGSNTAPKTVNASYLIAGTATFAGATQGSNLWEVTLGARSDGLPEADDIYAFRKIEITAGKGVGQVRRIRGTVGSVKGYNNTTRVAQLYERWAVMPDGTSTYTIYGGPVFMISTLQGLYMQGINFVGRAPTSTDVLGARNGAVGVAKKNIDGVASQSLVIKRCSFNFFDIGWDNDNPFYNQGESHNNSEIMFEDCIFQNCRIGFKNNGSAAVAMSFHNCHWINCNECIRIEGGGQISLSGMIQVVTCNHFIRRMDSGTNLRGLVVNGMLKIDSQRPRCVIHDETTFNRHGIAKYSGIDIGSAQADSETDILAIQQSPDTPGKCRITFSGYNRELVRGRKLAISNSSEPSYNVTHTVQFQPGQSMVRSGTAQDGSNLLVKLDAGASAVNDAYRGYMCRLTSDPGKGQERLIRSYNGTTKEATVEPTESGQGWSVSPGISDPDVGTGFEILTKYEEVAYAGLAQSPFESNAITFDAGASAVNDAYKGWLIRITAGTWSDPEGDVPYRVCTSYNGTTKRATIAGVAWTLDGTSKYEIRGTFVDTDITYAVDDLNSRSWTDRTPIFRLRGGTALVSACQFIAGSIDGGRLASLESNTYFGAPINHKYPITSRIEISDCEGLEGLIDGVDPVATYLTLAPSTWPVWYLFRDCNRGAYVNDPPVANFVIAPPWTIGNYGMNAIRIGLAQAATAGTITLDAQAPATADIYNGNMISIIAGTGAGQTRIIHDYLSMVASVSPNWAVIPDATSMFQITPGNIMDWQTFEQVDAQEAIDTSVTPWAHVRIRKATGDLGTGVELRRRKLKDINNANITDINTVVGRMLD